MAAGSVEQLHNLLHVERKARAELHKEVQTLNAELINTNERHTKLLQAVELDSENTIKALKSEIETAKFELREVLKILKSERNIKEQLRLRLADALERLQQLSYELSNTSQSYRITELEMALEDVKHEKEEENSRHMNIISLMQDKISELSTPSKPCRLSAYKDSPKRSRC
eukprot:GHVR01029465.1.p1 GENE.GHVR01029465.1~~GHVR01029465.1.p1  ORF type:complete len:171 (+),score=34.81 GHVR01029465.1:22-534(+)